MSDDEHAELDFDPLDHTYLWPKEQFPMRPVGRIVLHFTLADPDYGRRVAEGIGIPVPDVAAQPVGD